MIPNKFSTATKFNGNGIHQLRHSFYWFCVSVFLLFEVYLLFKNIFISYNSWKLSKATFFED